MVVEYLSDSHQLALSSCLTDIRDIENGNGVEREWDGYSSSGVRCQASISFADLGNQFPWRYGHLM